MASEKLKKVKINSDINLSLDEQGVSSSDKLIFPNFDSIKVSTKTFIVMTNMTLDIDRLFNFLPVTDYILVPKRRGRKKKNEPEDPNKGIETGSIITLEYQNQIRGVDLKKKKKNTKKRGNYFRNSVTIVMIIEGKKINFKVSRNGKFQMTGCKFDDHSEKCVKWFWKYIKNSDGIYNFIENQKNMDSKFDENKNSKSLKVIFIPAMRNIDFDLNFCVDREKLDEYFNNYTDYNSLLETSFGYTGVNIKMPISKPIQDLQLKQLEYIGNKWLNPVMVPYNEYLKMISKKDVIKKLNKKQYNTFLVFHSGKVIMSGMEASFMKDVYYEFLDIIRDCYDIIEERLGNKDEILSNKKLD